MDRKDDNKSKHTGDVPAASRSPVHGDSDQQRERKGWRPGDVDERKLADRRHRIGRRLKDRPSILKVVLITFLAIMIGVFEEFGDPFGVASFADNLSATIYNNVMSPFYGRGETLELTLSNNNEEKTAVFNTRFGQKQVLVILIDDQYLEESGQSWPLAPSRYKRLLRNLSNAGSAAVFFDIYLEPKNTAKEKQIASLYAYAARLRDDTGTPIVFAGTLADPVPAAAGVVAPDYALAQMNVEPGFYSFNVKRPVDPHSDNALASTDTPVPAATPTAAWRLYQHWCKHNVSQCGDKPIPNDVQALGADEDGLDDLYIQWGAYPNQLMTSLPEFGGEKCQQQASGFWSKFWQSALIFFRDGTQGIGDGTQDECTYSTQINLRVVNNLSAKEFAELFKDKVVLIGASLSLYPDLYYSPAQGYLPGVFWHAMALDNMIEYGNEYRRKISSNLGSSMESIVLALILIAQAIMSWILHNPYFSEELEARLQIRHSLFLLCVISCVVVYTAGIHNWAPANWVGIAILALIIDAGPIKILPKYSWRKRPFQPMSASTMWSGAFGSAVPMVTSKRLNLALAWLLNVFAFIIIFISLVMLGLLIFIVPNANIVGREYDQQGVSWFFLILYGAIATSCLIYFLSSYNEHRRSQCEK